MKIRSLLKFVTPPPHREPPGDNSPTPVGPVPSPGADGNSPSPAPPLTNFTPSRPCVKDRNAHTGKISRLTDAIRNQVNHRLLNGQSGPEILAWLNELPHVQKILDAQFDGVPVSVQNLSNWRTTGYQEWLDQRQHVAEIKGLGIYSKSVVDAGRGSLSSAAATLISGKVLKFLEAIADENSTPEELAKIAAAINPLLKAEQNILRINIARQRVRQRDAQLLLMRDRHQRDVAAISLRVLGDARARAIEASDCSYEKKLELIGRYLFDDLWDPRPTQPNPEHVTDPQLPSLDQSDLNPKIASMDQAESR